MEIMTPNHPRWREFYNRLEGPEGCDFKEGAEKGVTWRCKGRRNFIGIEIDPTYFAIAERRIADAQMQLPLLEA